MCCNEDYNCKKWLLPLLAISSLGISCKTQFLGNANVPGGTQGCVAVCQNLGMQLAGMVVMGEYSNGCICEVPNRSADANPREKNLVYVGAQGAAMAATAGVDSQTETDDNQSMQNNQIQ